MDYGVIQGSNLGPLLFLIYINNISKVNVACKIFLFADDSALFFRSKTWDELFQIATRDMATIKKWFDQNILTLNVSKTKFMPISLRDRGGTLRERLHIHTCGDVDSATCGCQWIDRVESYKYLGAILDCKLSWSAHINYLNKRLRKCIFAFKQLNSILNLREIKMAYFSYVQSIIEGAIIAWGGAYRSTLQPLAVTQKAIIKAALGKCRRYPSEALYNDFTVLDLRQLFVRALLIYMYKHSDSIFDHVNHTYPTRSALTGGIQIPRLTKTYSITNCHYILHILYRNIPDTLKITDNCTIGIYKKRIKTWLEQTGRDNIESLITSQYRLT